MVFRLDINILLHRHFASLLVTVVPCIKEMFVNNLFFVTQNMEYPAQFKMHHLKKRLPLDILTQND